MRNKSSSGTSVFTDDLGVSITDVRCDLISHFHSGFPFFLEGSLVSGRKVVGRTSDWVMKVSTMTGIISPVYVDVPSDPFHHRR